MPLVSIQDLSIRYRGPALLDSVNCIIEPGQRIGLLGRNGAGKTTLLRILSGEVEPDHGTIHLAAGAKIAMLPQDVPKHLNGPVLGIVRGGVSAQETVTPENGWEVDHKVDQILSRMQLDPTADVASMSSGMKRRVLLARALVDSPDLLLLDEPTNHLDIDSICWLEDFLSRWPNSYMFITHDRQFLRQLATRILEIDGGRIFDWTCDYETFLRRKDEALAAQEKQDALFDKKLAAEEVWIRQGIKARRTRNEGRVRALKKLRQLRSERREKIGTTNLQIQVAARSGALVIKADGLEYSWPGANGKRRKIISGFSTTIMQGDKVGIIGPNGAGKTTLLKLLLGEMSPEGGSVRLGTNLQIAYFDQLRQQLDESKTVEQDVSDGYQTIQLGGSPRHILGYLQDFLFTPERARTPIKQLSGGERNRVLLAKLFAKPVNVVVLDEPTNDLDAETLEMLEERLVEYQGTLLVVSHDREFLNNVVTSTIVFESERDNDFAVREYVGGYDDWFRISQQRVPAQSAEKSKATKESRTPTPELQRKKLSFKEQKELQELPARIELLESQIAQVHHEMTLPEYYKQSKEALAEVQVELVKLQQNLVEAYARWEQLEMLAEA